MPNHYTTLAICAGCVDYDKFEDVDFNDFADQHKESDLCRIVKPIPEELEDIHTGHADGMKRWREVKTGDTVDRVAVDEADLKARYGHADWYEWAKANWGTKWGTYGLRVNEHHGDGRCVTIEFQSAWGPPICLDEIAQWLSKLLGFKSVRFIGFDPYDDKTHELGKWQAIERDET
jgi:hypothetical protein